jgi:hypothetical protein
MKDEDKFSAKSVGLGKGSGAKLRGAKTIFDKKYRILEWMKANGHISPTDLRGASPPSEETVVDFALERLAKEMREKKTAFLNEMLTKKGFPELATFGQSEQNRFPKLAMVRHAGWEYYFADNGTRQGAFIVAVTDWFRDDTNRESPNKILMDSIGYRFRWQDWDFTDVVL